MPLALQIMPIVFEQIPSSYHGWRPPAVLSTRLAFLLYEHTTVSSLTGEWGKCSRSSGIEVHGKPSPTSVPARNNSSPIKSSRRWGSSSGGHSNSSSSFPPSGLDQSDSSHNALSVCQVGRGNWWALSTWYLFPGSPHQMKMSSPLQMLPNTGDWVSIGMVSLQ